jgi:glycine cleavage system H protein
MESFTYTNIFETKGIEYIAILVFFAILIPFWILLNKKIPIKKQIKKALGFLSANVLKIPQGVFHSQNHTWAFMERNGEAKVGLDDLLLHITGEVKVRSLKNFGENVNKGDLLLEIDQNGKMLKVFSPISGKIMNTNDSVGKNPEILNQDPYGNGWIYKIKPVNWKIETNDYLLAEETIEWSKKELERFKDFLAESVKKYSPDQSTVILQDGGELRDNTLSEFPEEVWKDFQEDFLKVKI